MQPVFEALDEDPRATNIKDLQRLSGEELAAAMEQHKLDTTNAARARRAEQLGCEIPDSHEHFVEELTSTFKPEALVKNFSLFARQCNLNIKGMIERNGPSDLIDPDVPFKFRVGDLSCWCEGGRLGGEGNRLALLKSRLEAMQADDGVSDELKAKIAKALTLIQPTQQYRGAAPYWAGSWKAQRSVGKNKIHLAPFVLQADAARAYDVLSEECGGGQINRKVNGRHTGYNFESIEAWAEARNNEMQTRGLTESDDGVGTVDTMTVCINAKLQEKKTKHKF